MPVLHTFLPAFAVEYICSALFAKKSCFINGQEYQSGQTFQIDCNTCTCRDGQPICTLIQCTTIHPCATVRCGQPICRTNSTPPEECCPTCPPCVVDGTVYQEGAAVPCPYECKQCVCRGGEVVPEPVPCPPLTCTEYTTAFGDCCPTCNY